jgi:hypothetical protein
VRTNVEVIRRLDVVPNDHSLQCPNCPPMDAETRASLERSLTIRISTENPWA